MFNVGKNIDKVRYNIKNTRDFKLIDVRRLLVVYFNANVKEEYKKKLKFLKIDLYFIRSKLDCEVNHQTRVLTRYIHAQA